jgi:hypothetical protein
MYKISQREKTLLIILAVIGGISILYFFIITPLVNMKKGGDVDIKSNIDRISKIDRIYDEYKDIKQESTRIKSLLDKKNENITTQIEQWSNATNIAKNVAYTRRNQTNLQNKYVRITTDMKIDGIGIEPLLKFLYEVENSGKLIKISYIRIQQALKGTDTYDVILKIDSYTMQ